VRTLAPLVVLPLVLGAARSEDLPRPRILGISHVAFRASDLEASRRFYRDLLGLSVSPSTPTDPRAFLVVRVNERQTIELRPGLVAPEDRLDHVAFQIDDVAAARRALSANGVKCLEEPRDACSFRDTEGHAVELVRHSADGRLPATSNGGESPVSSRLLHAGLLVGALEETRRFYEALGFRETWRGSRSGTDLSWTNMKVPDGDDYIEFMLYGVKPAPHDRGVQHHVCLEVPDVEAARGVLLKRVESAGYSRALDVRIGTNRRRQMNLYDPDGTRVELMEPQTVDGQPVPSSTAPPPKPASPPAR
jgi:catechol 2,3-dioxygenase-like lactoylglutathione lyase family enzyme